MKLTFLCELFCEFQIVSLLAHKSRTLFTKLAQLAHVKMFNKRISTFKSH